MSRYRWRTRLRGNLPWSMLWLAPKGKHPCGAHEWYRVDNEEWNCYHCEAVCWENSDTLYCYWLADWDGGKRITSWSSPFIWSADYGWAVCP